jgi:hypothetical protein
MTYFYPGLSEALDDLENAPGGPDARRVIVIITDGEPQRETAQAEIDYIERDLLPRLHHPKNGRIQLYVLAFGPEATRNIEFFLHLVRSPAGTIGEVMTDPTGTSLLDKMRDIFASSFGYVTEAVSDPDKVPLGEPPAQRAAVVGLWMGGQAKAPDFDLTPLNMPSYNQPSGVLVGFQPQFGAAYSVRWVLSPHLRGDGRITGYTGYPAFAILRPTEIRLSVEPAQPGFPPGVALAGQPLSLLVRARSISGSGAPSG